MMQSQTRAIAALYFDENHKKRYRQELEFDLKSYDQLLSL
jgi:hypothetical protein